MACLDYQNECLRVVTIDYLRRFVDSQIQNSAGAAVSITHSLGDDYCPTYGELTAGTIVQNWSQGGTPNGDRDGIVVNPIWAGGDGSQRYKDNQLVDQKDLSIKYTRFKSFSVSSPDVYLNECGRETEQVSYTHKYTRYTKSVVLMDSNCTVSTTSSEVSDTANSEITWSVPCDWVSLDTSTLVASVDAQPENRETLSRCCTITGSVTFRNTGGTSSTDICQEALTGGYTHEEGRHYVSVVAVAATKQQFDCCGGTYGITGTGNYFDRYEWVDSCERVYHSEPYKDVPGTEPIGGGGTCTSCEISGPTTANTAGDSIQLSVAEITGSYAKSGTFSPCDCCSSPTCCDGCSDEARLSLTYHDKTSNEVVFTQNCQGDNSGCCPEQWVYQSNTCTDSDCDNWGTKTYYVYPGKKDAWGDCVADTSQPHRTETASTYCGDCPEPPAPSSCCDEFTFTGENYYHKEASTGPGTCAYYSCIDGVTITSVSNDSGGWLYNIVDQYPITGEKKFRAEHTALPSGVTERSCTITIETSCGGEPKKAICKQIDTD